jgi:hypothetical protein
LSELRRGKLGRFSLETLIRFLAQMRYRVELTVVKAERVRYGGRPASAPEAKVRAP